MKTVTQTLRLLTGASLLATGLAAAAPVFTPDSQPTGWVTRPAVTFTTLTSGTESFFQTDFNKRTWWGNVLARDIDDVAVVQTTGPWDELNPTETTAASLLDLVDYSGGRRIATRNGPFRWLNLTAAEQTAIGSEEILNFLRGDRSNEEPNGLSLRKRDSVLGDILHASLVFWDHGSSQSLYVGANDGMLHSFDAATGAENWAYVPSMQIAKMGQLANKPYVHTHFVDGPIHIGNIDISGTQKTLLIGGLGAGGAGLYALDITTPGAGDEQAVANKVLWEITAGGSFADLGHTYAMPLLTRLPDGTPAVIVGNGYVNSGSGHAVLYVINATTGGLIRAMDTGSGTSASPNGLSSPTLYDEDFDGRPDLAYAGDIDGNVWKFNLSSGAVSLLFTTSPAQAITAAPAVQEHPLGGQMVLFATGRVLTSGDQSDAGVHYVYGIWDGAPQENSSLLVQALVPSSHGSGTSVRTVTSNEADWSAGGHKGWRVALPAGERVVGERPFANAGRFYFVSTNPTISGGANWLHELVILDAGSPLGPIFDLNKDGLWNDADLAVNGDVPVAKYLGSGVYSQPLLVRGNGIATTLYSYHPDLPVGGEWPPDPEILQQPGVAGGEFDYDIFYYDVAPGTYYEYPDLNDWVLVYNYCKKTNDVDKKLDQSFNGCSDTAPVGYQFLTDYQVGEVCKADSDPNKVEYLHTLTCNNTLTDFTPATTTISYADYATFEIVNNYCKKTSDVDKNEDSTYNGCKDNASAGYEWLAGYSVGSVCKANDDPNKVEYYHTLTCHPVIYEEVIQGAPYKKFKHVHQYDNKYNVTGVNMLNASDPEFNLENAIKDPTTEFKILMMNQYLNPGVMFSVGGADYESVRTYAGLASQTNASVLLNSLAVYTRETIGTLIFNMPKDGFASKDWWGDGILRAGLIPTQTGCVNGVATDGALTSDPGRYGERFNGSWAIQLIKPETPPEVLEINGPDVRYGWRVKAEHFTDYVLAEYLAFWHHDNGECYHEPLWVPDPYLTDEAPTSAVQPPGAADPTDLVFTGGLAVVDIVTTVSGSTTTTVTTFTDGSTYVREETANNDGSTTVHQIFQDGSEATVTIFTGDGGNMGYIDPSLGSPEEDISTLDEGRKSWRELFD